MSGWKNQTKYLFEKDHGSEQVIAATSGRGRAPLAVDAVDHVDQVDVRVLAPHGAIAERALHPVVRLNQSSRQKRAQFCHLWSLILNTVHSPNDRNKELVIQR